MTETQYLAQLAEIEYWRRFFAKLCPECNYSIIAKAARNVENRRTLDV